MKLRTPLSLLATLLLALTLTACDGNGGDSSPADDVAADVAGGQDSIASPDDVQTDGAEDPSDAPQAPDATVDVQQEDTAPDVVLPPEPAPVASVDPFIGTGAQAFNVGNAFPGACTPYGLAASPDTTTFAGRPHVFHCGGYRYEDSHVMGFSHMHLHGVGIPDYGTVRFAVTRGPVTAESIVPADYMSTFDHASEEAALYAVTLDEPDVRVELTAGPRAAWHRYTFAEGEQQGVILVDLSEVMVNGEVLDAALTVDVAENTVRGWQHSEGAFSGRYDGFGVYFEGRFDREFAAWGVWDAEGLHESADEGTGPVLGAWFAFDTATDADVELQVGLSLASADNAAANLAADLTGADLEAQREAAATAWQTELDRVQISGTTEDERTIFYTALYHTMMMPTLLTDVNGQYVGLDKEVHQADGFTYYTDFSLWDTFRTLHPLVTLLDPARAADFAQSLTKMAEEGGKMPRWPQGTGYSHCMIGSAADCVIAGTYIKGVTDFDVDSAYAALLPATIRGAMDDYEALGYVSDAHGGSVSKTLEYAFEDWCIGNLAAELGEAEDAERFHARSLNYRNLWDAETQFFRPRTPEGEFVEPFTPTSLEGAYTEASAWQYSWFVPHDVPGLVDLFGSAEAAATKLDSFFAQAADGFHFEFFSPYYYHGNEPSMQAAYMFLEMGRPDLAQEWARWVMATNYRTDPGGIIGNDDAGTLAAWYVFSALGFYPIPGSDRYYVGSPIVRDATLHLPSGDLVITVEGGGPDAPYVSAVTLNGEPLEEPWFRHADIVGGATLHFEMSAEPQTWGTWLPTTGPMDR